MFKVLAITNTEALIYKTMDNLLMLLFTDVLMML